MYLQKQKHVAVSLCLDLEGYCVNTKCPHLEYDARVCVYES